MGGGSWTRDSFTNYATAKASTLTNVTFDSITATYSGDISSQEMFKAYKLDPALNPKGVIRECCDSEEHPNTLPVILALDVTGSMGSAAVEVAKKLNVIMTELYGKVKDIEFMIMGIGDLAYDIAPIQASQFESDIRIAEQLDKMYFEYGGGGNSYESYTAAWYFGSRHTKLDCWNRGKKGIIITMGDERLNPYLPVNPATARLGLNKIMGDNLQGNVETKDLYAEVVEKFDVYHLNVEHGYSYDQENIKKSWSEYLNEEHFRTVNLDNISKAIIDIILHASADSSKATIGANVNSNGEITW